MPESDLGSVTSGGKVFFSSGLQTFSDQANLASAQDVTGRSGVVLIGLGQTGEDALRMFFERLPQNQSREQIVARSVLIKAGKDAPAGRLDPNIEDFVMGSPVTGERMRVDTMPKKVVLGNIRKYLEDQFFDFRHNLGIGVNVRCFFIVSLSETESGMLDSLLETLAKNRASVFERAVFVMLQSPHLPFLDQQHQFSAVREMSHYLQVGVHIPEDHAWDKLVERIYFFEGSRNRQLEYQNHLFALVETLLALVSEGASLSKAIAQSVESNHSIRAVGIRNLGIPLLELSSYFASRMMNELWTQCQTLFPPGYPPHDEVNARFKAFQTDAAHLRNLEEWLGRDLSLWLQNPRAIHPQVNESKLTAQFVQKILDFLADLRQPARFSIVWAGLWFVEGRAAGLPQLQDTCRKLRAGLEQFIQQFSDCGALMNDLSRKSREALAAAATGPISRWMIRNLDERTEQIYQRLLNVPQREKILDQLERRSGLSARYADGFLLSPVFISTAVHRDFFLSDHILHDGNEYFTILHGMLKGIIFSAFMESPEHIQPPDVNACDFLEGIEAPLANLENPAAAESKYGFLFASREQDVEFIKRHVFKFTSNFTHVPRIGNRSVTALNVYTNLNAFSFKYVKGCAEIYTPDENTHIDEHLKNAAYFEKLLRKSAEPRAREPLCEQVIMTLFDRNAPIVFFRAFLRGLLRWHPAKMEWRLDAFAAGDEEYPELRLGDAKSITLSGTIQKENIRSLWLAYWRFSVEIPFRGVPDGALQHPLHPVNRQKYLEAVLAMTTLDNSPEQNQRRKWLEKQTADRGNDPLYPLVDFYRLYQAVLRT